ncbi:MAG: PilZ domain-containing protein [Pyrinomonadaceae bacterium]
MKDDTKSEKSLLDAGNTSAPQHPRSPRVPVNFEVGIVGRDESGEPFSLRGEAVKVSRGGATLITEVAVKIGEVIKLTPPFGRAIDAEVNGVWTDEADGKQRIGVKLLDQNGWFAE